MTDWVDLVRRWVPRSFRHGVQRFVPLTATKLRYAERNNPLSAVVSSDEDTFGAGLRVGIVRNAAQYHRHYVAACLEIGVPFEVLDLSGPDWVARVQESACDAFLVWPDAHLASWNTMIKDRITVIESEMDLPVFPTVPEVWLYEDKRRMAYWLQAHSIPHPKTWIFHDAESCEAFIGSCDLPVVFKAVFGAGASGVRIFHERAALRRWVKKVFRKGFVPDGYDRRDRQWGSIVLQEFLPEITEWRLVRIGDSFFGHVKGQKEGMHSGSGVVEWDVPEGRHLDFLESVTDEGGFRSMDVDVFETPDGRLLVNELQTVFGASHSVDQLRVDGVPGRFLRGEGGAWVFEAGDFARNHCANERVRFVLERWLQGQSQRGEDR